MKEFNRSFPSKPIDRWWELPSMEEAWLIGIKYRRVLLGFVVAVFLLFIQERLRTMDDRLFQPSYDGVRGLIHYEIGHYSRAAVAFRSDLRSEGWTEWANGNEAYTALLQGNLSEAARLADLQLIKQPDDIQAWLTEGEVALEGGNIRRAADAFDHALSLEETHFDALLLSAISKSRSGNFDQAIDRLRRALRTNSAGQRITAFLWALQITGDIHQDQQNDLRWCLLAHFYRYLRIFDPSNATLAREAARKAIELGSGVDDAYITLGVLEEKTGDYDAALPYFLKAVEANPRNSEAYRWAANMYRHRGSDLLNEYKMWKAASDRAPGDVFYQRALVAFLTHRFGDYPQAIELAHRALEQHPQDEDLLTQAGTLNQRLGNHEVAIRYFTSLIATHPKNSATYDAIAASLFSLERKEEAIQAYKMALSINAYDARAHAGLASIYDTQKRMNESIHENELALKFGGEDIDLRAALCTRYFIVEDYARSKSCFERVLTNDPHHKGAKQLYPYVIKNLKRDAS